MLIGLYGIAAMPPPHWTDRAAALAEEAERQGALLCYFDDGGVYADRRCVHALVWESGKQRLNLCPYPDVIIGAIRAEAGNEPTETEMLLRAAIPFTSRPGGEGRIAAAGADGFAEVPENRPESATAIVQRGADSRWQVVRSSCCAACDERAIHAAESVNEQYPFLIEDLSIELAHGAAGPGFMQVRSPSGGYAMSESSVRHAIAYAIYLAKLCYGADCEGSPAVGLLAADDNKEMLLHEACAYVAAGYRASLYRFRAADLDPQWPILKGCELSQGRWESRYRRYPDALIDRLKKRRGRGAPDVYRRLADVPCADERTGAPFGKLKLYRMLRRNPEADKIVIPYRRLRQAEDAVKFVGKHGSAVIKPSKGSYGERIAIVESLEEGYALKEHQGTRRLSGEDFMLWVRELLRQRAYLIQKLVDSRTPEGLPFHIRVHLVRNESGGWTEMSVTPYIALRPDGLIVNHDSVFRTQSRWNWLLTHRFPGREDEIDRYLSQTAARLAVCVEEGLPQRIGELGMDFGIDPEGRFWLYEINLNKIGAVHREFELARIVVPAAIRMAQETAAARAANHAAVGSGRIGQRHSPRERDHRVKRLADQEREGIDS